MIQKIFTLGFLIIFNVLTAQQIEWVSGYYSGYAQDLKVGPDGTVYSIFQYGSSTLFNADGTEALVSGASGEGGCRVVAMNPSGAILSEIPFISAQGGLYLHDLQVADDGSIYVTGAAGPLNDLDPGAGEVFLSEARGFVLKFSASGQLQWMIPLGDYDFYQTAFIALDADNNLWVTGHYVGNTDFDPSSASASLTTADEDPNVFIAKYTSDGALIWVKKISSGSDTYPSAIAVNSAGIALIVGTYSEIFSGAPLDLDPGAGTDTYTGCDCGLGGSAFFVTLDSNGDFVEGYGVEDISIVTPMGLTVTSDDAFVVAGEYTRDFDVDFGSGENILTSIGALNFSDIFFMKLNADLTTQWVKKIGSATGNHGAFRAIELNNGNLLFSGYSNQNAMDIDPGSGTFMINGTSSIGSHGFILELSDAGDFVWGAGVGSIGSRASIRGLDEAPDGSRYALMDAYGTTTFGEPLNVTLAPANPDQDNLVVLAKLGFGNPTVTPSIDATSRLIYPQPAADFIHFRNDGLMLSSYTILSMAGRTVDTGSLTNGSASIAVSHLSPGMYILLLNGNHGKTERVPLCIAR
jgi:hypothetical protein